ncbi:hypothetical protein Pcinc_023487 [Petrolisthes cinctipes]|uniref:DUF5580 domain-containing protein n=1 Tax=Petrolisthes cinctipes TaxID=88211 RepID=A0AAE1FDG7_PETCI|nr:hypothetical protein Pcinc_023487 [Petrolisthes cinctipes]
MTIWLHHDHVTRECLSDSFPSMTSKSEAGNILLSGDMVPYLHHFTSNLPPPIPLPTITLKPPPFSTTLSPPLQYQLSTSYTLHHTTITLQPPPFSTTLSPPLHFQPSTNPSPHHTTITLQPPPFSTTQSPPFHYQPSTSYTLHQSLSQPHHLHHHFTTSTILHHPIPTISLPTLLHLLHPPPIPLPTTPPSPSLYNLHHSPLPYPHQLTTNPPPPLTPSTNPSPNHNTFTITLQPPPFSTTLSPPLNYQPSTSYTLHHTTIILQPPPFSTTLSPPLNYQPSTNPSLHHTTITLQPPPFSTTLSPPTLLHLLHPPPTCFVTWVMFSHQDESKLIEDLGRQISGKPVNMADLRRTMYGLDRDRNDFLSGQQDLPATTEFLTDEGFSEDEQQRQQQQQQQQASSPMYAPPPPAAALEQEEELGFDVQKWSSDYQYLAQAIYMADLDQSGYMPAAEVHHVTSTYNLVYNLSISGPTLDSALTAATDPNYGEVNLEYFIATLQDVHFRENGVY